VAKWTLGVILDRMTLRRRERVATVLARRQPDLTVVAESVHKPHNLSAVLRSCDAVGIGTIHAVQPTGGVPTYTATSASAERWVDVMVHGTVEAAVAHLRRDGLTVYATRLSHTAVDYRNVDFVKPCAIIIGNEREGVTREAAELADAHIIIPMLGMVQSLNVSVATAVVLFEAQRQRLAAGLYDEPRLLEDELDAIAQRWLRSPAQRRHDKAGGDGS